MGLAEQIKIGDWRSVRSAIAKLNTKLGPVSKPTFVGLTLTGFTASRLVATNADKKLVSSNLIDWVTGTANRIIVSADGGGVTLTGPQDIHTGASPTFAGLTLDFTTQDYVFGQRVNTLAIQSRNTGSSCTFELYNKDGDGTDETTLILYSRGTPTAIASRERLVISAKPGAANEIYTEAQGEGTLRPLVLYTEGNANQLLLNINGSISMSGALAVSGTFGRFRELHLYNVDSEPYSLKLRTIAIQTADWYLNLDLSDASRNLTLTGNPTLGDWFDQSVKVASSPTHIGMILTGGFKADTNTLVAHAVTHRVGIGTMMPATKLHVSSDGVGDANIPALGASDDSTGLIVSNDNIAYGLLIGTLNTGVGWIQVQRVTGGATGYDLLLQPNAGNVGINDITPAEKLDVNGNINATGVLKIDDTQVISNQGVAVADATDADDVILRLNDLLARVRAHGLIAT